MKQEEQKHPRTTQDISRSSVQSTVGRGFKKPFDKDDEDHEYSKEFQKIMAYANYFSFRPLSSSMGAPNLTVHKYHVEFTPTVEDTAYDLRRNIIKKAREAIKEKLGRSHFLFKNTMLLSNFLKVDEFGCAVEHEGQHYTLTIKWVATSGKSDPNIRVFYKAFVDKLVRSIKFMNIGTKYFDRNNMDHMNHHEITLLSGFSAIVGLYDAGAFLKIDMNHRVLSQRRVLDEMAYIRDQDPDCFMEKINEFLTGKIIITTYNFRCYRVDRVDFQLSPRTQFTKKVMRGQEEQPVTISVAQHMDNQYNLKNIMMDQPLLVNVDQKTQRESYLLPQFSGLTGLSDENRKNFKLMKDLAEVSNMRAQSRISKIQDFLKQMMHKSKETLEYWDMQINLEPQPIRSYRMHPGTLKLKTETIDLMFTNPNDLDRKCQSEMVKQPAIDKWCVFYNSRDQEIYNQLENEIKNCASQTNYSFSDPYIAQIHSHNYREWEQSLKEATSNEPGIKLVVLLLPSRQKKGEHYHELKSKLNQFTTIPSQVVLTETIRKGKNIRSIASKILVQICAKVGGCPWAFVKIPFTKVPTMVCGLDLYHKKGRSSYLAFVASCDQYFAQYFSYVRRSENQYQEAVDQLQTIMEQALQDFKAKNGIFPANVILYRDGVPDSQEEKMASAQIDQIQSAIRTTGSPIKFAYISVNKRIMTRMFTKERGQYSSPPQGLIVDKDIVRDDPVKQQFYLVSQAAKRGVPLPTKYVIIASTLDERLKEIELLTYRLCFLYYNVTGAISEPAPIRYAHRLSNMIGEAPEAYIPNQGLRGSLYFI